MKRFVEGVDRSQGTMFTKMLDAGDVDGYAVWKRIVEAIKDTERETPRPGGRRH